MLVLCKYMFIIIAAIQNNEKHCDIYFDRALCALLCLVFCDQCSIAHVCSVGAMSNNRPLSLVSVSYIAYY